MKRVALALTLLAIAACERAAPTSPSASAAGSTASSAELGRRIYNSRCYFCHGYAGDAKTVAASYLTPPPLAFSGQSATALTRARIVKAVTEGRAGTSMQPFSALLTPAEIGAVADFVVEEFVERRGTNTRYHNDANGWPDHERFRAAFAFASGALRIDTPWERLTADQATGKRLFLSACISCHEGVHSTAATTTWDARPLSYPRNGYRPGDAGRQTFASAASPSNAAVDAIASASPYAMHERAPRIAAPSPLERAGERIYQANCAFCHAADGTGKNWIGRFMEPHARDLTNLPAAARHRLITAIAEGLPGTSMPAWKSVLSETEIEAVASYVQRAFMPAD